MRLVRKFSVALTLAMMGTALFTVTAFAHECFVANKPAGAGGAGAVMVNIGTGEVDFSGVSVNPAGQIKGGFADVTLQFPDGTEAALTDVFVHVPPGHETLPDGAVHSGPGDSACDGVGIDEWSACLAP